MGIMDEMMNEAVDAAFDNNELEEEADEEVEKVLNEVIGGIEKEKNLYFHLLLIRYFRSNTWFTRSCC